MERKRDDIFSDSFRQKQDPDQKNLSFSEGISNIAEAFWHLTSGLRHIFLKKIPMNLLVLILIIIAAASFSIYARPSVTGSAVADVPLNMTQANQTQKQEECPKPEPCAPCVCEMPNCPKCIDSPCNCTTTHLYHCRDGRIVTKSDECENSVLPKPCQRILDDSSYLTAKDGISASIEELEYKSYHDGTGYVKSITYAIINQGEKMIKPRLDFKVYEDWSAQVAMYGSNFSLIYDDFIEPNDCVIDTQELDVEDGLVFKGDFQTLRMEAFDTLKDPDERLIVGIRSFPVEYPNTD